MPHKNGDTLAQTVPRWQWRMMRWRRGTTGWLRQKTVAVRCRRVTSGGPRHEAWLVGECATQRQPEEWKYFWSNLPPDTSLEALAGYAHRRHAIEPCHEEATGEVGWDQYQGRLWPGLRRHAVTVMLAYCILVWLERQQWHNLTRQDRRRDPFSSSAAASATVTPSQASVRSPCGSGSKPSSGGSSSIGSTHCAHLGS